MSAIPTVGPTGGVRNRLNAVDFVKDEKFFTLYVRALAHIQARPQNEFTSFFQVAGIHGLPFTEWGKKAPLPKSNKHGYCTHGAVTFPTWHRAYMSIYEQIIQTAAIEIAGRFTVNREEWAQAALDLRQPFWDWGLQLIPPEELLTKEAVEVTDYDGTRVPVPNPILRYHFHPVDPSFDDEDGDKRFELRNSEVTVRNPDANQKEDIPALIKKMKHDAKDIRGKTHKMLQSATWEQFSNHGAPDSEEPEDGIHSNSLEAVHDSIHVLVGFGKTSGHMTHSLWAAFDPIFWFHHANVDRLLSIWQAMHPDLWVTPGVTGQTFAFADGNAVDKDTPLEPFYRTAEQAWTSAPLADTQKLGYSYPEFDNLIGADQDLVKDAIYDLVDRQYGIKKSKNATNAALDLLSAFQGITEKHSEELKMYDWSIHASFKKFELAQSFSLIFYFAADGGDYNNKESYVGTIDAFRGTTPATCENCRQNANLVQEGFIHLNRILAKTIKTFEPQQVIKFLQDKKLSCVLFTGEAKPLTTLKVTVEGQPLRLPPDSNRPQVDKSQSLIVEDNIIDYIPLSTHTATV